MKILITGGLGFVGQHLCKSLTLEHEILISSRSKFIYSDGLLCKSLNLTKFEDVDNFITSNKIQTVIHLSAQSSVHVSFENPIHTMKDNILSTLNLLEVCQNNNIKLIVAGTSEVYKTKEQKLTENSELEARSPYTISKMVQDSYINLLKPENVILLRLFNHVGPGQSDNFVLSSFAKQLANIKKNNAEPVIYVGNLNVSRDFTDVRDVCRIYSTLVSNNNQSSIYNVCSGNAYNILELLKKLIEIAKIDVEIKTDPSRIRKIDVPFFVGDNSKITNEFGWKPEIKIEQTLEDMFNWWMGKI
jgi:GDP-4-dehydro-6-deoxy-D-mannose reductase